METQLRKYTVSPLTLVDIEWFVSTAAVDMLTNELKRPELVNYANLYNLAHKTMMEGTSFVARVDGEPVGALGSVLAPNLYNPDIKTLVELFWYVLPEYRETRAGLMLLRAFEQKAEEIADESTMSLLDTSLVNVESIEKRGYMLKEYAFIKLHKGK